VKKKRGKALHGTRRIIVDHKAVEEESSNDHPMLESSAAEAAAWKCLQHAPLWCTVWSKKDTYAQTAYSTCEEKESQK